MATSTVTNETNESKVLFGQAREMLSRNRMRGALARFEEALQISPDNAEYLSFYGLCIALAREDYDTALRICERAVKMDPDNPINRVNLGKVYKLQGENSTAYDIFIKAWKLDKSHPAAAAELSRMGVRRPPVISFLPRSHWLNKQLGVLRSKLIRGLGSAY